MESLRIAGRNLTTKTKNPSNYYDSTSGHFVTSAACRRGALLRLVLCSNWNIIGRVFCILHTQYPRLKYSRYITVPKRINLFILRAKSNMSADCRPHIELIASIYVYCALNFKLICKISTKTFT